MSFKYRLARMLFLFILLAVGLIAMANVFPSVWEATSGASAMGRLVIVLSGLLLWCAAFLTVLASGERKSNSSYLSFDNEGGKVSVSLDAISDYVVKLRLEFPSIIKMYPTVVPARNAIDVVVKLTVKASPQINEVCEMLQKRIRESIVSGLGIADVRRVEVSVTDIVSEHIPSD